MTQIPWTLNCSEKCFSWIFFVITLELHTEFYLTMFSPWTLTEYELVYGLRCEGIAPIAWIHWIWRQHCTAITTTKFILVLAECSKTGNIFTSFGFLLQPSFLRMMIKCKFTHDWHYAFKFITKQQHLRQTLR